MSPIYWKLGLTIAAGVAVGTVGGQSVIAGMAPPAAPLPSYAVDRTRIYAASSTDARDQSAVVDHQYIVDNCDDCSDFDLGYRFAAARKLRETAECMDYSWSYQRGCLAYLREG